MSDRSTYALNTISRVVSKIDADLLDHPVLGANLVEVDEPDTCISCGVQPTQVTTTKGEEVVLANPTPEDEAAKPKPRANKPAEEAK